MSLDVFQLRSARPGNPFHYWDSIGSTMTEAARLAASGAPHGTVVLADEQTSGSGRLGRSWQSQAGVGVYCSLLLRIHLPPVDLPVASLLLGLAVREAIQQAAGLSCDLRWPNDVLIRERKVAGILAQVVDDCIVAGIGINVNNQQFPGLFRTRPTSLYLETGRSLAREPIVVQMLASVDDLTRIMAESGTAAILKAFALASTYVLSRRIVVEDTGARGTTAGLDEHCFLLVKLDSGRLEKLLTGGVRPVD
jgi:BirA family biotin operon repressor/biotin-[acetyl-CoA-carboxylase] ligase